MGGKNGALTVTVRIEGARETLKAFRDLPKDASEQLRQASTRIAEKAASRVANAARAEGRQAALIAPTVKARRDRVPVIVAGGSSRVGRRKTPAFKVLFGSEFGAHLRQFKPHHGAGSYWMFKTVQEHEPQLAREWTAAADRIVGTFTAGG